MGERYYIDESGSRQTLHRDMLQMQREQRKTEARASRDSYRDKIQKAKDELFNGSKKEITRSVTRDNKQENGAKDDVKIHKKDQKPNTASSISGDRYTAFDVQYVKDNSPATGRFLMDVS